MRPSELRQDPAPRGLKVAIYIASLSNSSAVSENSHSILRAIQFEIITTSRHVFLALQILVIITVNLRGLTDNTYNRKNVRRGREEVVSNTVARNRSQRTGARRD